MSPRDPAVSPARGWCARNGGRFPPEALPAQGRRGDGRRTGRRVPGPLPGGVRRRRSPLPLRRPRLAVALLFLGAVLFPGSGCGPREAPPAPAAPTAVLVTIDTLRADRLGCYGRADADTPNLDRLAGEGARFDLAVATAPLTLPSHASILSGRTVPAHGVRNNGTYSLPAAVETIAEVLRAAGWDTGAFVSSQVLARRYGLDQGFAVYDDRVPRPAARAGLVVHYGERPGRVTVDRALAWLATRSGPAFLWVHLWEPHYPYVPPPPFRDRHPDDPYQGEVATADAAVGRLVDGVRSLRPGTKLLVAVVADHGESLGEHGESTHGIFVYGATTRVPMIVWGPACRVRPAVIGEPASTADLAPTLLELLGMPPLPGADGESWASRLRGETGEKPRVAALVESHEPRLEFGWSGLRAVVFDHWRFIDAPRQELYDLSADPGETRNLARTRPAIVGTARELLADLLRRARASTPASGAEREVSTRDLDELRSLGYAASGRRDRGGRLVDPSRPDPKDRTDFLARYDEAMALLGRGKVDDAIRLFEELSRRDPRNPSLFLQWGQALILAHRLPAARRVYERLVAIDPAFGLGWYRLGQVRDNLGDLSGAEAAYRRAIEVDPLAVDPRKALASLLADRGRVREAIDLLEKARDLAPDDEAIRRDLERFWRRLQGG